MYWQGSNVYFNKLFFETQKDSKCFKIMFKQWKIKIGKPKGKHFAAQSYDHMMLSRSYLIDNNISKLLGIYLAILLIKFTVSMVFSKRDDILVLNLLLKPLTNFFSPQNQRFCASWRLHNDYIRVLIPDGAYLKSINFIWSL